MLVIENWWQNNELLRRRATVCEKRNGSYIMTYSGCHRSINQPQLLLWSLAEFLHSIFMLLYTPQLGAYLWSKDDFIHFLQSFSIKLDLHHARKTQTGVGGSAKKAELILLHSKKEGEDEGVWRNAAVQTALWFGGHGAQCDSMWLKHRGDHLDVHPPGPVVFSFLLASLCVSMCLCVCVHCKFANVASICCIL